MIKSFQEKIYCLQIFRKFITEQKRFLIEKINYFLLSLREYKSIIYN